MKIYFVINLNVKEKGGVFQFFGALKKYFTELDLVTENPEEADIFFISASQFVNDVLRLKLKYKDKVFIHRIDGPIRLYNTLYDPRDIIVNMINYNVADATVFQSNWSKLYSKLLGIKDKKFEKVILNAPDPDIFNTINKLNFNPYSKIKIISTSWSINKNKGFDTYQWLDENLDFNKFEYTFIGNTPIKFKNIKHIEPLDSISLATKLKENDIFISASKIEACSNALMEALHCGLPAIAFNGSSNPEIINNNKLLFNDKIEIPSIIEEIINNYQFYQKSIAVPNFEQVANEYLTFIGNVKYLNNINKISYMKYLSLIIKIVSLKVKNKIIGIFRK